MSYPLNRPITIYAGTSANAGQIIEAFSCKGVGVFVNYILNSGPGTVSATLKYRDGLANDFAIASVPTVSSVSPQGMLLAYPGLGTSSQTAIPTTIINGIIPANIHVDTVVVGAIGYQVSAFPMP